MNLRHTGGAKTPMKYKTKITDGLKRGVCCRHLKKRVQPEKPKQFYAGIRRDCAHPIL
jgi:hypothetical protein